MRKMLLMVALTITTTVLAATHEFQTGKLASITADETLFEGTSYRRAIFTVQIGDLVITSRGTAFAAVLVISDKDSSSATPLKSPSMVVN